MGVLSKNEALRIAREQETDLVVIAEKADPPVARLIDFHKFLYKEKKRKKEEKKKSRQVEVKDLRLSLFMADADKQRIIAKAKNFLKEGHQVKFNLVLRGRENVFKDRAVNMLKEISEALNEVKLVKEPRVEGNVVRMIVSK
ncbi:MAG: translation initiation factor IF-3 [Patescibacteria group bacterium]|nr:MAG: translation initiation factor IF-3 [Patescibacteria group bacterium]